MLRDWYKINKDGLSPRTIAMARDAYDNCIAALDRGLGKLFAELKRRGVLENTLVILTADHGEQFGEHGRFGHGLSLHAPEVHVPLLIVSPASVPRGRTVREGVSLRDIPATIVDLLGYERESPFPGTSLARTWQATPGRRELDFASALRAARVDGRDRPSHVNRPLTRAHVKALLHDKNVYIRHQDGDEELYEVDADPAESRDLSQCNHARAALERCRLILDRLMVATKANQAAASDDTAIRRLSHDDVAAAPNAAGE